MIRQDRFPTPLSDNGLETGRDLGNRFVPGDTDKLASPFTAVAPQGIEQTILVVHAASEMGDFVADKPVSGRMVLRPTDALDFPFADRDLESTGVGAIHSA